MSEPLAIPRSTSSPSEHTEHCHVCRSDLRAGQAYCMRCGTRRQGARHEFLDVLEEDRRAGASAPLAAAAAPAGAAPRGPLAILSAPVAIIAVTLLIGLLVGHWLSDGRRDDDRVSTQVIRVLGAGGGTAATADDTASASSSGGSSTSAAAKEKAKAAAAKRKASIPKVVNRKTEKKVLDDTSGTQNLAPKDADPNGANFDEIK